MYIKNFLSVLVMFLLLLSPVAPIFPYQDQVLSARVMHAEAVGADITGNFFADFDVDGFEDVGEVVSSDDPLYPANNISVFAYDVIGNRVACSIGGADNNQFACVVSGLVGTDFRLEFVLDPADVGFNETFGTHNSVQFASSGDNKKFGFLPPSLCPVAGSGFESNPNSTAGKLWATCFVNGLRTDATTPSDVLVGLNYDSPEGQAQSGDFFVEHLGHKDGGVSSSDSGDLNSELGSVWGVAYDQWDSVLFTSAMLKRHSDLGSRGLDGLYWMTYPGGTWNSIDLNTAGGTVDYGADPATRDLSTGISPSLDTDVFPRVAKTGIGDINLTPDGNTLVVTNIEDREVVLYDVTAVSAGGNPSYLGKVAITNPGCSDVINTDDYQIWGLHVPDESRVLLGVHCTAENSTNITGGFHADLEAHLVEVDITNPATPVQVASLLSIPLAYERGCGLFLSCAPNGSFQNWQDVWNIPNPRSNGSGENPQPVFSDIEIHYDGSLTLGFMDRFSHQSGSQNYTPTDNTVNLDGFVVGETLHVCNTTGDPQNIVWEVEGQVGCDSGAMYPSTNTDRLDNVVANGSFHGGPYTDAEWYGNDTIFSNSTNGPDVAQQAAPGFSGGVAGEVSHTETTNGGVYVRPYTNEIVVSSMDPYVLYSGGLTVMSSVAPEPLGSRALELYFGRLSDGLSGKSGGVGDIEGCFVPMEVGNYVWLDLDADGRQDPGETPLENVTVTLHDNVGALLATTVTNSSGEYYFNSVHGVNPLTQYEIRFDVTTLSTTLPGGYTFVDLNETSLDVAAQAPDTTQDNSDSDITGIATNISSLTFTTGAQGSNDHTLDAGYVLPTFDLALTKTTAATVVSIGQDVTFNVNITNQGTIAADNIAIIDYIPAGFILNDTDWLAGTVGVSGQSALITLAVAGGELPAGGLAASGGTVSVPITLTVAEGATAANLVNYAEISGATDDVGGAQTDIDSVPDTLDNNDTGGTLNDPAQDNVITDDGTVDEDDHDPASVTLAALYDLALIKTTAATFVNVGDIVTFDITVTNQESNAVDNIEITDYIPTGFTLADTDWVSSGSTGQNATVTLSVADGGLPATGLGGSESVSVSIDLRVNSGAADSTLVNYAEISGFTDMTNASQTDVDSTPDSIGTNDAGGTLNDPAQDNVITDDGTIDEDDHDPASVTLGYYDLALRKTGEANQIVSIGDNIPFTIEVFNQGNFAVDNVRVIDYIPEELVLNDQTWTDVGNNSAIQILSVAGGQLPLGGLAPDTSVVVTIMLQVAPTATSGDIVNYAEIASFLDLAGHIRTDVDSVPDSDPDNDSGGTPNDGNEDDVITDDGTVDEDDADPIQISLGVQVQCVESEIGNLIFEDVNCDGKYNEDIDEPMEDVMVRIFDENDNEIDEDETDEDGRFNLHVTGAGRYHVEVDDDDIEDYVYSVDPGSHVDPNNRAFVTVDACGDGTTKMDFGFIKDECELAETGSDLMCKVRE